MFNVNRWGRVQEAVHEPPTPDPDEKVSEPALGWEFWMKYTGCTKRQLELLIATREYKKER